MNSWAFHWRCVPLSPQVSLGMGGMLGGGLFGEDGGFLYDGGLDDEEGALGSLDHDQPFDVTQLTVTPLFMENNAAHDGSSDATTAAAGAAAAEEAASAEAAAAENAAEEGGGNASNASLAVPSTVTLEYVDWEPSENASIIELDIGDGAGANVVQYHGRSASDVNFCGYRFAAAGAALRAVVQSPREFELSKHMLAPEVQDTSNVSDSLMAIHSLRRSFVLVLCGSLVGWLVRFVCLGLAVRIVSSCCWCCCCWFFDKLALPANRLISMRRRLTRLSFLSTRLSVACSYTHTHTP